MKLKKALIIQFHAALRSNGITDKELKQEMVFNVSKGRVTSSSDLTEQELETLIANLNGNRQGSAPVETQENTLRRRIISKYREMGYNIYDNDEMKMVADMKRIEAVVEYKWKKKLNDYTTDELTKIIAVLETVWLPNYYKNKTKTNG